jgi:hypothetical protein
MMNGAAKKEPYLDIDSDQIVVQELAQGSVCAQTVILRRGQHLSAYELDVAKRHHIPVLWR